MSDLMEANSAGAILTALAWATWYKTYEGQSCPPDKIPSPADIAAVWAEDITAQRDTLKALIVLHETRRVFCWGRRGAWLFRPDSEQPPPPITAVLHAEAWSGAYLSRLIESLHDDWRLTMPLVRAWHKSGRVDDGTPKGRPVGEADRKQYPIQKHPLARLVEAYQKRPKPARANLRSDRILPAGVAMVAQGDRRAGRLFAPAAHVVRTENKQLVMPGFEYERSAPALPLVLYDLGAGPVKSSGTGAPLALRLFVESILAVELEDRERGQAVTLSIPLRKLLARLYPNRCPRPNEYMPRLKAARTALASDEAGIYWPGGRRWAVLMSNLPVHLDDAVRLMVDLPPGSGQGPIVSPRLPFYGVKSGAAYRALLNLAYWWFEPGVTRIPARGGHWLQVNDPKRYRRMTAQDRVDIVFPTSSRKNKRRDLFEAEKVLRRLVNDGEARFVEGKLLPPLPTSRQYHPDAGGNGE